MRISRLHLARFAMFTDIQIDLMTHGVNVIVGNNEAGKSSTMAAVQDLLYGIPMQSRHNYVHAHSDMRIGAIFHDNDNNQRQIYRIKKNANTLRSADDQVLPDNVLTDLLGGVGPDMYRTLFSIGHAEIVEGGEQLFKTDGELGRALFGAGTGLTQLNTVMKQLDDRAESLFKSGGSKPKINTSLRVFKEATDETKRLSQSASEVEQLDKDLQKQRVQIDTIAAKIRELTTEIHRTTRVNATRPLIGRRRNEQRTLASLDAQGPRIPMSVATMFGEAQQARRTAQASLATLVPALALLDEQLAATLVDDNLLAHAPAIEGLVEELGSWRKNYKDLPGLNKQVGDLERDLESLMRRLPTKCRADVNGKPLVSDIERTQIDRLAKTWEVHQHQLALLAAAVTQAIQEHRKHADEFAALAPAPDVTNLRLAVARVRADGQLEVAAQRTQRDINELTAKLEAEIRMARVTVDIRAADALPMPSPSRVNEIDNEVGAARAAVTQGQRDHDRLTAELMTLEQDLGGLLSQTDPPSLDDLEQARQHRQQGWQHVRAAWLESAPLEAAAVEWAASEPLDRAFENAVGTADEVADRLRREADAVQRRAALEHAIAGRQAQIDLAAEQLIECHKRVDRALGQWNELWTPTGITPGTRSATDEFTLLVRDLAADSVNLRKLDVALELQREAIARNTADIAVHLREIDETPDSALGLGALLDRAEVACAAADEQRHARTLAEQAHESSKTVLDNQIDKQTEVQRDRDAWQTEWAHAVVPIGANAATAPPDVANLLVTLNEIDATSKELDELRMRVSGIERRNSVISTQADTVVAGVAHLGIDTASHEVLVTTLQQRLKASQAAVITRSTLSSHRETQSGNLRAAQERHDRAASEIASFVQQFGLDDERSLAEAIERSHQATALDASIVKIETDLVEAHGLTLTDIEAEVDRFIDVDTNDLLDRLAAEKNSLDAQHEALMIQVGATQHARAAIDDSDAAAQAAGRSQMALAEMSHHADDYVRVRLAKYLLEQHIDDYRSKNQGPILARAGDIFTQLTLEKYSGIETDAADNGQPIILAKRANAGSLDVKVLSTGTRDQLYLSLRLAALEQYATGERNLPLILDDLFVHFDDDRTRAGLRVLEDLSTSVQVLLFTHHERVATQATEAISPARLRIQILAR